MDASASRDIIVSDLRAGRLREAARACAWALEAAPDDPELLHLHGLVALQGGQYEEARARIVEAIAANAGVAKMHSNLGIALVRLDRFEEAAASFRRALTIDPDHVEALCNLGNLQFDRGEFQDSEACLRRALALSPNTAEALVGLGFIHSKECRWNEALACFRRADELQPDLAGAKLGLSAALGRTGRIEEARVAARDYVRLDPISMQPSTGRAKGAVLALYSVENAFMRFRGGKGVLRTNANNAIDNVGADRFSVCKVFVGDEFLERVAPRLPPYDVVWNVITEPDNCPHSLAIAQKFSNSLSCPVINRPEPVMLTSRDGNYRRLGQHPGLTFMKTVRRALGENPAADLLQTTAQDGFDFPVIVRRVGTHSGNTVERLDNREMIETLAGQFAGSEVYVIQYKDCTLRGGLYSKLRFFAIGGELYPWNFLIGDDWNVHSEGRDKVMQESPWMQDLERRFVHDPKDVIGAEHYRTLEGVCGIIGLDYFGIDFTVLDDGELVVFEANAAVGFFASWIDRFPYLQDAKDRIRGGIDKLLTAKLAEAR